MSSGWAFLLAVVLCGGACGAAEATDTWSPERAEALLVRWCDALVARQVRGTCDENLDGAVLCPACGSVHGRFGDAVYPLIYLYVRRGDSRYLRAAEAAVDWVERTMVRADGANDNDYRNQWFGITVFAQTSMGKTLLHFADRLPDALKARWMSIFRRETAFVRQRFDSGFVERTNINYPATFCEAMALASHLTGDSTCLDDAAKILAIFENRCLTDEGLLYGEHHPPAALSPGGRRYVDLGYNCEESLPALVAYASAIGNADLKKRMLASADAHAAFILPDGALDNSAGSRSAKWTYYGSRTSDGLLPLLADLAKEGRPWAVRAIDRHLNLLERCTLPNGLLAGGLHHAAAHEPACVHHAFTHAKSLVDLLLSGAPTSVPAAKLPREAQIGMTAYPSMGAHLVSLGPWRATFSAGDAFSGRAAMVVGGGAPTMLWSRFTGPLIVGSMAEYDMVEPLNMQDLRHERRVVSLTPRFECGSLQSGAEGRAAVVAACVDDVFDYRAVGVLRNGRGQVGARYEMTWRLSPKGLTFEGKCAADGRFVLPLVAQPDEPIDCAGNQVVLRKKGATVMVESSGQMGVLRTDRGDRAFHPVAGLLTAQLAVSVKANENLKISLSLVDDNQK